MKLKVIALVTLVFASTSAQTEDMHEYLRKSWALAKEGKHQEALDRYIWFHNHALEYERGMHGVRLSFALGAWKDLGESYPPALVALKKIRDDNTALLEAGKGRFDLFDDVASINRTLEENNRTVELFRILDKQQSDLAKRCWRIAEDAIIEAEAYDLVQKYLDDPVRRYDEIEWQYENSKLIQPIAINDNRFVERTIRIVNVAIALDNMKAAKEIQKKALTILDDSRLKAAIPVEKIKQDAQPEH